ncbi:hypothetical protein Q5H92_14885 [Hymenobacter sp. M29]|uniref:XRE family transcriptional regulator n=1 Tax=Hymenobacter mellowenesis TaxID=3063995 RepID=A0ABT9AE24_9BACT|nr:hypothetical protein [Hymenobacter sp. M29]MDO7847652.1 hypothetical protein [Hymenobacter sp. M29]
MNTPTNPGLTIKSQLVLHGYKLRDLVQKANHPSYASLTSTIRKGTISPSVAQALEAMGVGKALEWVTQSAAYKLYLYQLKETSA